MLSNQSIILFKFKQFIRSLSTDVKIPNDHENADKLTSEPDRTTDKTLCTNSLDSKVDIKPQRSRKTRGRETRVKTEEHLRIKISEAIPHKEKEPLPISNAAQNNPKRRKNR